MNYHRQQGYRYEINQVDTLCGKLVESTENRQVYYQKSSRLPAPRDANIPVRNAAVKDHIIAAEASRPKL